MSFRYIILSVADTRWGVVGLAKNEPETNTRSEVVLVSVFAVPVRSGS